MSGRFDISLRRGLIHGYESVLKRRKVFRHLSRLERSQWASPTELEQLRIERLRKLLLHARDTTGYYHDTWNDARLDPEAVKSLADFRKFPVIDRTTIATNRERMRSSNPCGRLIAKSTGGSSGVPLHFDLDSEGNEERMAAWHRGYGWADAGPGTRQWYLWGVPPEAAASWRKRKLQLYDRLYRRTTENCFELGESTVEPFAASLARTRPDVIVAYTGALYAFARMLEARGIVPFSPNSIVVGAEALHDFQRELIERIFRAPVFETYGSREFMLMAAECDRHNGLHLTAENHLIEILDDDGAPVPDGIEGNVIVTDFTNFGMPFIRYLNGDRAVMSTERCDCGRALPMLKCVTGRRLDILTTPSGQQLPGEFFPHIMKEFPSVQRFQVIQRVPQEVEVLVVAPGWTPTDEEHLCREVAAVADGSMVVRVTEVDDIPLTAAGKLKVVVNLLDNPDRTASPGATAQ